MWKIKRKQKNEQILRERKVITDEVKDKRYKLLGVEDFSKMFIIFCD